MAAIDPAMQLVQGYAAAIFGAGKPVKPILQQPPSAPGDESAVCPPGFVAQLVGPGQYECVPKTVKQLFP